MSAEYLVILCGIGIVALLWLVIRFGRTIARFALILASIVLVGIVAVSGLVSSLASFQTARTAQTAIRATSITSGLAGVVIGGLAVGGQKKSYKQGYANGCNQKNLLHGQKPSGGRRPGRCK